MRAGRRGGLRPSCGGGGCALQRNPNPNRKTRHESPNPNRGTPGQRGAARHLGAGDWCSESFWARGRRQVLRAGALWACGLVLSVCAAGAVRQGGPGRAFRARALDARLAQRGRASPPRHEVPRLRRRGPRGGEGRRPPLTFRNQLGTPGGAGVCARMRGAGGAGLLRGRPARRPQARRPQAARLEDRRHSDRKSAGILTLSLRALVTSARNPQARQPDIRKHSTLAPSPEQVRSVGARPTAARIGLILRGAVRWCGRFCPRAALDRPRRCRGRVGVGFGATPSRMTAARESPGSPDIRGRGWRAARIPARMAASGNVHAIIVMHLPG